MWGQLAALAAGALMGAQKNKRNREIEDADRKLAAETQRYSWVTGNKADPIRRAGSTWMDVGQGATSGLMFGQQLKGFGESTPTAKEWQTSDGGASYWDQLREQERQRGLMDAQSKMFA